MGSRRPPPHPRPLAPAPPPFLLGGGGGFTENPRGGGGSSRGEGGGGGGRARGVYGEFGGGGAEAPFTVKMSPVFGENAFFVKGRVWQICPRSGFWGPGISKTMACFCQGSTAGKDFGEDFFSTEDICLETTPVGRSQSRSGSEFFFQGKSISGGS